MDDPELEAAERAVHMFSAMAAVSKAQPEQSEAIAKGLVDVLNGRNHACAILAQCASLAMFVDGYAKMSGEDDQAMHDMLAVIVVAIRRGVDSARRQRAS